MSEPEPYAPDLGPRLAAIRRDAGIAMRARRARVLAHPTIAKRLTERPLNYPTPEAWTGYVPPPMWREAVNDSPERAALMDILNAVAKAGTQASNGSPHESPEGV